MPNTRPADVGSELAPCLLLIEDDAVTAEWIGSLCSSWGLTVHTCSSAAQALGWEGCASALLMDQHLPDGNAVSLLQELRRAGRLQPAIALSADIDAAVIRELQQAGFATWLRKPFPPAALLAALGEAGIAPPRWDLANARSRAAGSEQVMLSLRQLLTQDLPVQREALNCALRLEPADPAVVDAVLHRMLGGARLTGASALAAAIEGLRDRLTTASAPPAPNDPIRQRLFQCIDEILQEGVDPSA